MLEQRGFIDKMQALSRRLDEVGALLTDHEVIGQRAKFMALSKEHAELSPIVEAWRRYDKMQRDIAQARGMIDTETDPELREMAREDLAQLMARLTAETNTITIWVEHDQQLARRIADQTLGMEHLGELRAMDTSPNANNDGPQ